MKARDQKLLLLRLLGQESEPISLAAIVAKLDVQVSERTVRRWLNELAQEGFVAKSGTTKDARYVASKPVHRADAEMSSCFSSDSAQALEKIQRPMFERVSVSYREEWIDSYVPNQNYYLSAKMREELLRAGNRAHEHDPAGTYAHQIYNRLLIDLSYNSSRLEGNTYSLLDTERLLLYGESPEGKLDEEKIMILNHKEAIRYLVDNAQTLEVHRNTICTLHYLLSDGLVEPKYAGKVRDFGVRIGGSTYVPIEGVRRLEMHQHTLAEKARAIRDPFEQSIFLLIHNSYLQAFADVNKRCARLTANIPLIAGNLVPLAFRDIEVKDYMSAMIAIYELQDVRPLVDLYIYSYLRTCAAYDSTVKALGFDEVRVRYRTQRKNLVRKIILQGLTDTGMKAFIESESDKIVPTKEKGKFQEDVLEDLHYLDESRLSGLGVTPEELKAWHQKFMTQ